MEKIGNIIAIVLIVFCLYHLQTVGPLSRIERTEKCKKELAFTGPVPVHSGATEMSYRRSMVDDALLRSCIIKKNK